MNNSATTRAISKIALEYNANDKGMAQAAALNYLLSNQPADQFLEMNAVANRNPKVTKWALTGYISPPEEAGKSLSDLELTEIALDALRKIGVTAKNQFRLDIHNSTKQKHIHFIVNRINISGKCTVKAHDIGKRFGEAVRQVCKERNLKTDVEIGVEKKAAMLHNLTESLQSSGNFEELISKMRAKGFDVQLSSNIKDGISGMRIILEKDKNPNTEKQYKSGYTLSQISNKLNISEIKLLFEIKQSIAKHFKNSNSLIDLRIKMHQDGLKMKVHYKGEFKPNQKQELQDIWINKITHLKDTLPKNGFFYRKFDGFSLAAIDGNFGSVINVNSQNQTGTISAKKADDSILEVAEELLENVLKPTYVAPQEDECWKRKRKGRR